MQFNNDDAYSSSGTAPPQSIMNLELFPYGMNLPGADVERYICDNLSSEVHNIEFLAIYLPDTKYLVTLPNDQQYAPGGSGHCVQQYLEFLCQKGMLKLEVSSGSAVPAAITMDGIGRPLALITQEGSGGFGIDRFPPNGLSLDGPIGSFVFASLAFATLFCFVKPTMSAIRGRENVLHTLETCLLVVYQGFWILGAAALGFFLFGEDGLQPYAPWLIIGEVVCVLCLAATPIISSLSRRSKRSKPTTPADTPSSPTNQGGGPTPTALDVTGNSHSASTGAVSPPAGDQLVRNTSVHPTNKPSHVNRSSERANRREYRREPRSAIALELENQPHGAAYEMDNLGERRQS